MDITIENAKIVLQKYLQEKEEEKYNHSIRVAKTSMELAMRWGVNKEDAVIAGLLHDIGKSLSKQEMLSLCVANNIQMYDFEIFENIKALHGEVSSILFKEEFKGNDIEKINAIAQAIAYHVATGENMTDLDKVVFIADNIEPERGNNFLERIQSGEIRNMDECINEIIKGKKERAEKKGWLYNPKIDISGIER